MKDPFVTSPNLDTRDKDIVKSAKEFSGAMTLDLTDDEIKQAMRIHAEVTSKHQEKWRYKIGGLQRIEELADLIEEFEKEYQYRMMEEVECLVRVDGTGVFVGGGLLVEWLGKIDTSSLAKYGQDHEKKTWEVQKAKERGEDYLGQKDNYRSQ